MAVAERRWIGTSLKRREDLRFVTGKGKYLDDLPVGHALHVAFARSPHAHARIVKMDTSKAAAHPGVVRVLTGEEIARLTRPLGARVAVPVQPAYYALAWPKARFVGEAVAAVAAVDRATAEDAAELIEVEYEPLPAVTDVERAAQPDAPLVFDELGTNVIWHTQLPFGNLDGAFAQADEVVKERFTLQRYASTPLETYGCVASWDPAREELTVQGQAHMLWVTFGAITHALDLPISRLRFIMPDVGGGFGNKARPTYIVVCAVLSKLTGRPVKFVEDRRESLMALGHACEGVMYVEAAVKRDGTILGVRFRNLENDGVAVGFAGLHNLIMLTNLVNCYRLKAVSYEGYAVLSHTCPTVANRGIGKPFMAFAWERLVDRVADRLGLEPTEIRLRNFIQPDEFPYETPSGNLYDSGNYPATLRKALDILDYQRARQEQAEARQQGRYVGIGIATTVEPSQANLSYSLIANDRSTLTGVGDAARVKVELDGRVTVATGATSTGQGHETAISQIVADELGVLPEQVSVLPFDSSSSPWVPTSGNYANKFAGCDTGAIVLASRKAREKLLSLAAQQMEVSPEDLDVRDGRVAVRGIPGRSKSVGDIMAPAYLTLGGRPADFEPGIDVTQYYQNPLGNLPDDQQRVRAQLDFANSAHIALVEVDPETFEIKLRRYVAVHDCGVQINPMIVEGQVHGATAHGIGAALLEEFVYTEDGQFLSSTFMDYLKPTTMDVPEIETGVLQSPSPFTALGAKGAGEGGAIPAPAAVANAVEDALKPLGIVITGLPVTPTKLMAAARAKS